MLICAAVKAACVYIAMSMSACAHSPPEPAPQPAPVVHAFPHRFDNPEEWAPRFEDPARDVWQKPDEVIAALKLSPNDKIADIGAATGYFPVRLARALPLAKVYGVDIEPQMTRYLADRAANEGLPNLEAVLGTAADPNLPEKVDLVLVVDTFHHIDNRVQYFENLRAHVATGGRLAIIDFRLDSPVGPPPQHRLTPEQIRGELKKAGWESAGEHGFLPNQCFLLFTPVR